MIFIISDKHDVHADVVIDKIVQKGLEYFRFNLDVESLKETEINYDCSNWRIYQNSRSITDDEIEVVWFRRAFVELLLEEKDCKDVNFLVWKNEWNKILLGFYLSLSSKPTLCPLKASYAAENKFFQYNVAKSIGFNIPEFITSNIKSELQSFCDSKNNNVVLKLHHQDFYQVDNKYQGLYVNKISSIDLNEFNEKEENPITIQKYVSKKYEVRYTVVDSKHFCCRIDSQASTQTQIDWRRYDIPNTPHLPIKPPNEIINKVNMMMRELNINYGAFDFIVDKNSKWHFLEVNPMGQWLWIEDLTGLNISGAICDWIDSKIREVK